MGGAASVVRPARTRKEVKEVVPTVTYPGMGETTMPITPDLFTTAEAAEMLGLSPSGLRAAIHDGTLRVQRIDARTNAVTREEIERYRTEHLGRPGRRKKTPPATAPDKE